MFSDLIVFMDFLIFLLAYFISFADTLVHTDLCDTSNYWTHYGSHCYKVYNTSLSWEDAANMCRFLDAELPIIDDDNIQESLSNLSKSVQAELWTGISLFQGNWVNPQYENVKHINQNWTFSKSPDFSPNNRSCVAIREKEGIIEWFFRDCNQMNYFACSKPEGTCPLGWIFHQRTCYRYIDTLQTSWYNAKDYCQLMDSTLLEITNVDKQIFIHQLVRVQSPGIGNDDRLWLNLRKDTQGAWIWEGSTGSLPTFTNWFNETDESQFNCSYMDTTRESKWFTDIPCSSSVSTICSFDVGSSNWEKNMMKAEDKENGTSSECGFGWVNDPLGNSCYLVEKELLVWSAAEAICVKRGGHLISLDSVQEQGYISGFLHSSKDDYLAFWIGANSRTDGEGFKWSNGAPFAFYNWFPEQPDGQDGDSDECIVMFSSNGKWSDVWCDQRHSFICEKTRPSKVKTTVQPMETNGTGMVCPDGWKIYKNQCFLIERRKTSWLEASEFCKEQNGFLASVEDQNEQNFIFSQFPSDYCFNLHSNDTYCSELAAAGKCTDDLLFMTKQCPAACGICDFICHDAVESATCKSWAPSGCEENPQYMLRQCGKSCEGCEAVLKGGFWLGLRDSKDQTFVWENGEDVSFSLWRSSEPQGYAPYRQGCTAMAYQDGMWLDQDCNMPMPGFICKTSMQYLGTTTLSPGCRGNYISYESMCYKFSEDAISWNEAQAKCESENGRLATVNSRYIQAFLSSQLYEKSGNYWIGYKETTSNDSVSLWNSGHPVEFHFGDIVDSSSLDQTEACAAITTTVPVGIWSFFNCTTKQNFICETLRDGYTTTIASPSTSPPLMCPDGWVTIQNNCFKVFENSTWTNARSYCRGIGADLASIHSVTELSEIQSKIRESGDSYWIGLNDREKEEDWAWSDGTLVDYAPWVTNRIVNMNANEHCVVFRHSQGSFDDLSCRNIFPFICKVQKGVEVKKQFQPIPNEKCEDERFFSFNGSCFAVIFMNTTYFEAQRLCHEKDAELASIHNRRENIFLTEIGSGALWIGLRDLRNDGFQWTDGTPFDFEAWDSVKYAQHLFGAPGVKRHCSILNAGSWSPVNCGHRVNGFICKKRKHGATKPVSPPLIVGGCPEQFKPSPYNNKCYKLVKETKTWFGASDECSKSNGTLLSVKDQTEQDFVINLLEWSNQYLWIGLQKQSMATENDGVFLWESNKEVTYTNWKTGEPFKGDQLQYDCVEMQGYSDLMNVGTWKPNRCKTTERGFICEAAKDPIIPVKKSTACPADYVENNGRCYRFFRDIPLDWESANHFCRLDNGTLASMSTIYRYGFIQALGRHVNLTTYWIGLRRSNTSDLYMWNNGLPYIYTNWNQSEPSQKPGEDCVLSHNNKWKDTSCKIRLPFLCETIIETQPLSPALKTNCTMTAMAFNGACYHFELEQKDSWIDARSRCKQLKMDLVSVHSAIETEHMIEFVLRKGLTSSLWIGLSRQKDLSDPIGKVSFYWSDDSNVDYENWNEDEPSDSLLSQTEECVEIFTNGSWNDASCDQIKGFVCKESGFIGMQTTTALYDVTNSTDDNTTRLFVQTGPSALNTNWIKNPRVAFAIAGVVIGALLIAVAVGSIAFFVKSRKFLSSYKEPIQEAAGFENALYNKDEENVFISEL